MDNLRSGNYKTSLQLLRKAQDLLGPPRNDNLTAITLNNLGCFFKKTGKTQSALQYLHQALKVSANSSPDKTNLAGTHLNICAILSQHNDHNQALKHAREALSLLREAHEQQSTSNSNTTMIVALNNLAIEYEYLNNSSEALESYQAALQLSKTVLGHSHSFTEALAKKIEVLMKKRSRSVSKQPKILPHLKNSGETSRKKDMNSLHLIESDKKTARVYKTAEKITRSVIVKKQKLPKIKQSIQNTQNSQNKQNPQNPQNKQNAQNAQNAQNSQNSQNSQNTQITQSTPKNDLAKIYEIEKHKKTSVKNRRTGSLEQRTQHAISELDELRDLLDKERDRTKNKENIRILDLISETNPENRSPDLTLIQSCVRMFVARRKFLRIKKATTVIQKYVKGYQCAQLFRLVRSAAIFIQAVWKGYSARKRIFN